MHQTDPKTETSTPKQIIKLHCPHFRYINSLHFFRCHLWFVFVLSVAGTLSVNPFSDIANIQDTLNVIIFGCLSKFHSGHPRAHIFSCLSNTTSGKSVVMPNQHANPGTPAFHCQASLLVLRLLLNFLVEQPTYLRNSVGGY